MTEINLKQGLELLNKIDTGEIDLPEEQIKKIGINQVFKRKKEKFEYLKANNWKLGPVTPFKEIDELTKGFKKGGVVAIGGFSNTGKSQLSYYYAQHFLKLGQEVAYFSLEVASEDVLIMINQYYKGVSYKESASMTNPEDYKNLSIYDVSDYYKIGHIESYVRKFKPDIVFIDFLQILECDGATEYEQLTKGARRLQRLGIETGTTIIYLSQISNVDAGQKNLLEVGLKGSGGLVASADYVFILKRKGEINGEILMGLKKNKHGATWKIFSLLMDFENGKCVYDGVYTEQNSGMRV